LIQTLRLNEHTFLFHIQTLKQELNKHWKDVVEKNHYKSFDHRSFYFRQTDKKYLSTKHLVAEILGPHGTASIGNATSSGANVAAGVVPPAVPKLIGMTLISNMFVNLHYFIA